MKLYRYFRLKKYDEPLPIEEIKPTNGLNIEESSISNEELTDKIDFEEIKADITATSLKKLDSKGKIKRNNKKLKKVLNDDLGTVFEEEEVESVAQSERKKSLKEIEEDLIDIIGMDMLNYIVYE